MPTGTLHALTTKLQAEGYDVGFEDIEDIHLQVQAAAAKGSLADAEDALLDYGVDLDYLMNFLI